MIEICTSGANCDHWERFSHRERRSHRSNFSQIHHSPTPFGYSKNSDHWERFSHRSNFSQLPTTPRRSDTQRITITGSASANHFAQIATIPHSSSTPRTEITARASYIATISSRFTPKLDARGRPLDQESTRLRQANNHLGFESTLLTLRYVNKMAATQMLATLDRIKRLFKSHLISRSPYL